MQTAQTFYVSAISRAEIGIKLSTGKLELPSDETTFWKDVVDRFQATPLPFTSEHAAQLANLPLYHRDPFDRMLVAQCLSENAVLATTDELLARYGVTLLGKT